MTPETLPVANVSGQEVPFDPEQLRRIQQHPCFSEKACHSFGRMHLAVAPRCNIQCKYCIRDFDCVNESRPGVTSQVLKPAEALERVDQVLAKHHYIKVVAVAGPGEPLANDETFETLRLVGQKYPHLILCISTNGLLLPDKIQELDSLGVCNITVTMNAIDPSIGQQIYDYAVYNGKRYEGLEMATLLRDNQLKGIEEALKLKKIVKVNTVLIPGINDKHVFEIARKIKEMGVYIHNVMPLIPQYKFAHIKPPSPEEKRAIQAELGKIIKQMKHCRQCRSDAIGRLGCDIQQEFESRTREQ
ncbi:MAG: molybdenum cofactor biosynthesis protein A [Methanosaeta sp. PtaB.Bin039]|nr:MAG: molybdenum cofactor biosynthesis protein A [Methanosaeta sp. PtaB.Bin039]OPY45136.1 MAG: molybdenum cofactor biosynthesis protein A [Methanosaeta sp. PtaU1.Bin028]HQF16046.1 nitrogenase cofactor biosynthesis protein NifB [Methanotrichaceae archaeon]HQI90838.1 nitrogenase cofactor biosynthesis protein NifB [Methanotrichaceae archaeon]